MSGLLTALVCVFRTLHGQIKVNGQIKINKVFINSNIALIMNGLAHLTYPKSFLKFQNIDCFENGNIYFSCKSGGCRSRSLLNVTKSHAVKAVHVT